MEIDPESSEMTFEQFRSQLSSKEYKFLDRKTLEDIFYALDRDQNGSLSIADVRESLEA